MKTIKVKHRRCVPLTFAGLLLLFLLGCLMLSMDQQYHNHKIHKPLLETWSNSPSFATPSTVTPHCSANASTGLAVPSYLPQIHQNFLRYRHCRSFPILLAPPPCPPDLYLLLAIKSMPMHTDRRAALRDTWGRTGRVQGRLVMLVFLLGRQGFRGQSLDLQPMLDWESRQHGDLLQWDFTESFFNLTLKEVLFLDWFSRSCRATRFVFKGDDDVLVNSDNLMNFLAAQSANDHLYTGNVLWRSFPLRQNASKYFIPVEMFPDNKSFPPYTSGGGYLMSRRTVLDLALVCQQVELFPIDDVFVGMCLQRLGLKPVHHRGFLTLGFGKAITHLDPCLLREVLLLHRLNPADMRIMWLLMHDPQLKCVFSP